MMRREQEPPQVGPGARAWAFGTIYGAIVGARRLPDVAFPVLNALATIHSSRRSPSTHDDCTSGTNCGRWLENYVA
jgi:hypothetical protein